jgi:hypothetical protein
MLGCMSSEKKSVVQYEPTAKVVNARILTAMEKLALLEGLTMVVSVDDLGNIAMDILQAEEMLGKWGAEDGESTLCRRAESQSSYGHTIANSILVDQSR